MKIGITGAFGLLGFHTSAYLSTKNGIEVCRAGRTEFESSDSLEHFVRGCDAIVHLAGMNRGDDRELYDTNIRLTKQLLDACDRTQTYPHILFSSSVHIYKDTLYGASKKASTEMIFEWTQKRGAKFTNLILSHVFGEFGRPFYNSVVSTFCYQLAQGEVPKIAQDSDIFLTHALRVAEEIFRIIECGAAGEVIVEGKKIRVSEFLEAVKRMSEEYRGGVYPELTDDVELALFNTYRSYLYPKGFPVSVKVHSDSRGSLFEAIKTRSEGQAFLSSTVPGVTRGNHFHLKKIERFHVLRGEAIIRMRKLFSTEVIQYVVSGDTPQYVDIPTFHTHNITNTGKDELITLFWAGDIFNPKSPDTYPQNV